MNLEDFYAESAAGIRFTRSQASAFAKSIADDFNPIHDENAKLFCVPGDLLFAVSLARFGLSQRMCFTFSGMVNDQVELKFVEIDEQKRVIQDSNGKEYLTIEHQGGLSTDPQLLSEFTQGYVKFSGHNFQHVLVPLMEAHGVMLNPQRPLVMYQSMSVELSTLDIRGIELELVESILEVNGKKGEVRMNFCLKAEGRVVGQGVKRMAVRGLQPYDEAAVSKMIRDYIGYREQYLSAG